MNNRVVFLDRDGTMVVEPHDRQVDRLDKVKLVADVLPCLLSLKQAGFRFVMVTNQDGRGTELFPEWDFRTCNDFIVELFGSQGVVFDEVFVCPHLPADNCACRKPKLGLVEDYLARHPIDRARSAMIGDRETDMDFARALGIPGFLVSTESPWPLVSRNVLALGRTGSVRRVTQETNVAVDVRLGEEGPISVRTGIGFFDHMVEQVAKHAGFALTLSCAGDLEVDEHHTVEDTALALGQALREALGDKRGIGRYGFVLPMDEAEAQVSLDLSGRAYSVFEGTFVRPNVGQLPTELVPHFFRSLADSLGAAIHVRVRGENTHHMVESCFKGVGRALRTALLRDGTAVPSSKGVL